MKTQVTVRTIAEKAGVSAMTVSRALRGQNVDPETEARVREVAESLGYRRNLLVSSVMSTMRGTKDPLCSSVLAFLTAESASFRPEQRLASKLYLRGAQDRAAECGFAVEEFVVSPRQADSKTISRILYARNIRGVLIGPLCRSCGHLSLDWKEFSSSAISINLVKPDLNRCCVDPVQSVNIAIRNLKRLGYRRIGFGISPFQVAYSHHRSRAMYLDYQCELPREQTVRLIENWSLEGFSKWLELEKPDAIIGHGDEILAWLQALEIRVPLDIGYVDINLFQGTHVPFAGVIFDYKAIGAAAVDMVISDLLRNSYGVPEHPLHSYIQGSWRDGSTLRPKPRIPSPTKGKNGAKLPQNPGNEAFHPLARTAHVSQWHSVNLRKVATHSYRGCKDISKWEDGLGLAIPPGRHEFCSVPFSFIDEKSNRGNGFVLLKDQGSLTIPIGQACQAIYFLIAAGFIASHGVIAEVIYRWRDGKEETRPLVAYFTHPPSGDAAEAWVNESSVQDWWPTFPHFRNQTTKFTRVGEVEQDPVNWRYLYTLQWTNPRPNNEITSITIRHLDAHGAKLAIFAVTLLAPA